MRYLYVVGTLVAALVAVLTVAGTAFGDIDPAKRMSTTLSGREEVPPADPDGSGRANLSASAPMSDAGRQARVCWSITVRRIGLATAAHIHRAPMGQNGAVVVDMSPVPPDARDGHWEGCARGLDARLVADIIRNPTSYYVNVHNRQFPSGAIRGQLGD